MTDWLNYTKKNFFSLSKTQMISFLSNIFFKIHHGGRGSGEEAASYLFDQSSDWNVIFIFLTVFFFILKLSSHYSWTESLCLAERLLTESFVSWPKCMFCFEICGRGVCRVFLKSISEMFVAFVLYYLCSISRVLISLEVDDVWLCEKCLCQRVVYDTIMLLFLVGYFVKKKRFLIGIMKPHIFNL